MSRLRLAAVAVALALLFAPSGADAAEPSNYGPTMPVQQYLTTQHQTGEPVAVLGFPLCSDVDECRLLAGRDYVSPRISFTAAMLAVADQDRLLHCRDPERGAKPCLVVLYGEALRGRAVAPHRIEWRADD